MTALGRQDVSVKDLVLCMMEKEQEVRARLMMEQPSLDMFELEDERDVKLWLISINLGSHNLCHTLETANDKGTQCDTSQKVSKDSTRKRKMQLSQNVVKSKDESSNKLVTDIDWGQIYRVVNGFVTFAQLKNYAEKFAVAVYWVLWKMLFQIEYCALTCTISFVTFPSVEYGTCESYMFRICDVIYMQVFEYFSVWS